MEQGLTLEQLQSMGVKQVTPKPTQPSTDEGLSLEQMQSLGYKEIKPKVIPQRDAQGRKVDPEKYLANQETNQNIQEGASRVGESLVSGTQEQFMGGLDKIKSSIVGSGERLADAANKGDYLGGIRAVGEGFLGSASGAVQTAFSPVTSAIGTGIQGWMDLDQATGGKVKDSVASLARSNPDLVTKFNKMIAYDPQLTTDVIDLINVLGVKGGVKASTPMVTKGAESVAQGVKSTVPVIKEAVDTGIQAGKDMLEQRAISQTEKVINARAEELKNISNNYVGLKKKQLYNKDFDETVRRVASTDALVGAVDENGLITTKGKGGAVERYKAETLDGAEQVVRTNLERLGETVNLQDVEQTLTDAVNKSGLEGADLRSALSSIKKEISGYKLRADVNGNVPLTLIQDAKVSKTKGINYLTPPNVGVKDKAIANGLKTIVENNSALNVKEINNELAKYLKDVDFLESLDGKRVKGGKLGKYFAQISGNIIGGTAGAAVGGPVGSALGTIIGGELGGKIKGTLMSKTLGKGTGTIAPENKIIKEATRKATEYKKMSDDLKSFYKTYIKEDGVQENIINLDQKSKKVLNDWLNSTPDTNKVIDDLQKIKDLKGMYDDIYENGIEKFNALVKYQEGGKNAKFSDGLPEILGKKASGANRNLAPNSYAQKFQVNGDSFLDELGFADVQEANDFLDSFKSIIETRKKIKEDYSNSVGNRSQQYTPTTKTSNSSISPQSTPTTPKSKGIRGMYNIDELNPFKSTTKETYRKSIELNNKVDELSKQLNEFSGKGGLITEEVRKSPEFVAIKNEYNKANSEMLKFNTSDEGKSLQSELKKLGMGERQNLRKEIQSELVSAKSENKIKPAINSEMTSKAYKAIDKSAKVDIPEEVIAKANKFSKTQKDMVDIFLSDTKNKAYIEDFRKMVGYEGFDSKMSPQKLEVLASQMKEAQGLSVPKKKVVSSLEQEAKKYKSAEEFVKAQPVVYHGTSANLKSFNNKQGTYFTDDYMNADGYASGNNVYEGHLNLKNPLVIDAKGKLYNDLKTEYGKSTNEIVGNVDKSKYDGVIFKNIKDNFIDDAESQDPGTIYYAFKPRDSFLNESQLTDIWKKANGK